MCTWKHWEGPKIVLKDCVHRGEEWRYSSVEEVFSAMGARQHRYTYIYICIYIVFTRVRFCHLLRAIVVGNTRWTKCTLSSRNKVIIYDNVHSMRMVFFLYIHIIYIYTHVCVGCLHTQTHFKNGFYCFWI